MIVLDTNVLSEVLKPSPDGKVMAWLDAQPVETLYISTITVLEMLDGVGRLPQGRRRVALQATVEQTIADFNARHVLSFDAAAAQAYAELAQVWRPKGVAVHLADGMVGAVAHSHGFGVATRDARPFQAMELARVVNPWLDD